MSKSGMKKAKVHVKSDRALELERQKQLEEQQAAETAAKKKAKKKEAVKITVHYMLGIYSLVFACFSWIIDYMGILAAGALVLSIISIIKLKAARDKYFWFAVSGAALSTIRLIWELVSIIQYFAK